MNSQQTKKMKISHNIPMPNLRSSAKLGQTKYPFATMKVGDSFEVHPEKRHSVNTLAKKYGDQQKPKKAFTVRKKDGSLHCWRIK